MLSRNLLSLLPLYSVLQIREALKNPHHGCAGEAGRFRPPVQSTWGIIGSSGGFREGCCGNLPIYCAGMKSKHTYFGLTAMSNTA